MQFSESWLRTLVNPALSSAELAHLLTMAGLEVEAMTGVAPAFEKVVVGHVLSKEKHPDADRLNLLSVDVGLAEPLAIVCGAQNVTVGMKAPCALVGAKLPGIEIKQAKVRGIASFGMMCSAKELGLAEAADGLLELAPDAVVGQSIREHLDLDDQLLTLKLTPNRCDCLSLNGIAREVAALTGASLQALPNGQLKPTSQLGRKVKLTEPSACPRYTGRVISGVNAKSATPAWMVQRLERCGLRSISAIVDVTNYVLLEFGQPLHAFDQNKLEGDIEVRFARDGERLKLLNEQTVALQTNMLVIADSKRAIALAGIMGGAETAVDDATTDVFLESAFFSPAVIAGKSRQLGFSSDSSYRFERGVDFAATTYALDRATQLIIDICGGEAGSVTEATGILPERNPVKLRVSRVERVLGIALSGKQIEPMLSRLGMTCVPHDDGFWVTPPSYRFDISIEEDLIEEIARVHGYENILPSPPQASMTMLSQVESVRSLAKLRQSLALRDYQEAINYAFVDAGWERDLCANLAPVKLQNPISSQMSVMRSSLLGGLLAALRTNLARKLPRVRLFELGGCFSTNATGYEQHEHLAGVAYGGALPEQWGSPYQNVDFYDVKGDVEALFAPRNLEFQAQAHPASHPGRSAKIILNGQEVGWIGELHPQWQQQYDFPQAVIWFELKLDVLQHITIPHPSDVSKFPLVRRDIAIVVDESLSQQSLLHALHDARAPFVVELGLFDVYRGKGVENGKKSLAFRVLLQDTQKTLTETDIEQSIERLKAVLQQQGAQMRV